MKFNLISIAFVAFGVKLMITPGTSESVAFVSVAALLGLQELYIQRLFSKKQTQQLEEMQKSVDQLKTEMSAIKISQGWKNLKNG